MRSLSCHRAHLEVWLLRSSVTDSCLQNNPKNTLPVFGGGFAAGSPSIISLAHLAKFMPPPGPQPASRICGAHHKSRAMLASARMQGLKGRGTWNRDGEKVGGGIRLSLRTHHDGNLLLAQAFADAAHHCDRRRRHANL